MVRKTKWIEDVPVDHDVVEVARSALSGRLAHLWQALRKVSARPTHNDDVHQLRVASRRSIVMLELFEDLLPRQRTAWMIKKIKRVRQAAGEARNLDVLLAQMEKRRAAGDPRYAELLDYLTQLRRAAQKPIHQIAQHLCHKNFSKRSRKLVKRLHPRRELAELDQPTFAELAQRSMSRVVREFFDADSADLSDAAALHAFRIQGKHLRYAIEVFAVALPAALRESVYPVVAELQDKLGIANDHATQQHLFDTWADDPKLEECRELLHELSAEEARLLTAVRADFFAWWTTAPVAELRRRFAEVLSATRLDVSA